MSIRGFSLLASLGLAAAPIAPRIVRRGPTPVPATTIVDSLRILYIGRPAGWEHYELAPHGDGMRLTSDYD